MTCYAASATRKFFDAFTWAAENVGSKVGSLFVKDTTESSPFTLAAMNLGYTSVKSIVELLDAIECATKEVLGAASTSTVSVARYKYGRQVSELIETTFNAGEDAVNIFFAVRGAAVRSLATRAAVKSVSSGAKTYQELKSQLKMKSSSSSSTSLSDQEKEKIEQPILTQKLVQIQKIDDPSSKDQNSNPKEDVMMDAINELATSTTVEKPKEEQEASN